MLSTLATVMCKIFRGAEVLLGGVVAVKKNHAALLINV